MTDTAGRIHKGDLVYLFRAWDNVGTWSWYEYIVDSAGTKQIHLRSSDGDMLKRRVYTDLTNVNNQQLLLSSTVSDPAAKAIELAQSYMVREIAYYEQQKVEFRDDAAYVQNLNAHLEVLRAAKPKQIHKRV